MKRYILALMLLLLCVIGMTSRQVEAYSVTVQKDGVYADVIPDSFVNNTAAIFKKYVKKAMKYYSKYKDADDYTYITKVPDEYRDFISVAKQIQDSDNITIRTPFYIYIPGDDAEICERYWFFAEKNGEKLCMFQINLDTETKKISVWYNKMEDSHFAYDANIVRETLFYEMNNIIYAETPDKISVVWDKSSSTGELMAGADGTTDWANEPEEVNQKFQKKSYREKKEEIMDYLAGIKDGKVYNKVEKNLKLELKDEYVEPKEDAKESSRTGIYILIGIAVLVVVVITGGLLLLKRRKE